jgi:hypothetical protein
MSAWLPNALESGWVTVGAAAGVLVLTAVFFAAGPVSRGELRTDIDLELAADLMYGPIYYRFLVRRAPLNPEFADQVVDAVFRGEGPARVMPS